MALIHCPECGHEISTAAVACPNCGRPIAAVPRVEKSVVVTDTPRREGGFPMWAIIPLAVLGGLLLLVLFLAFGRDDNADNANLRVNVNTRAPSRDTSRGGSLGDSPTDTATTTVPPTDSQTLTVPGSQTTVTEPPAKGTVVIDAKIATRTGAPQAVKNEKFYLLDKDLETILSEAELEPIEGNSLMNSFGLSVMYPDRYGDFQRNALRAIRNHIKYSGTTDSGGKAELSGVEPDSYYLFGVTRSGRGFAVWSSPVSIVGGQNVLNLSPQRLTEIEGSSGD